MLMISKEQGDFIEDGKITIQVKSKLLKEKGLPSEKISVETSDGVVSLKGVLASENQAASAISAAGSVEGVKDVNTSDLKVSGSDNLLTDSYLTAKIKGVFLREKLLGEQPVEPLEIKVETKNGVVYLNGNVSSAEVEKNATRLAKQIKGVSEVVSNIKIKD